MEELSQEAQYQLMKGWLNERQWRLYVATEARRIGSGGISQVAREAGVSRKTIRKGIRELAACRRERRAVRPVAMRLSASLTTQAGTTERSGAVSKIRPAMVTQ